MKASPLCGRPEHVWKPSAQRRRIALKKGADGERTSAASASQDRIWGVDGFSTSGDNWKTDFDGLLKNGIVPKRL
jgi:hypothetical protein